MFRGNRWQNYIPETLATQMCKPVICMLSLSVEQICGSGTNNLHSCPHIRVKQDFAGSMFQFERILKSLSVVVMQQWGPQLSFCVWAGEQSFSLITANRGYHECVWRHRGPSVSLMEQQDWNRIHSQLVKAFSCSVISGEGERMLQLHHVLLSVSFTNQRREKKVGWVQIDQLSHAQGKNTLMTVQRRYVEKEKCVLLAVMTLGNSQMTLGGRRNGEKEDRALR